MEFVTTYSDAALDKRKLESKIVTALPSKSLLYDFTDGETHFEVKSGSISATITDGVQGLTVTTAGTSRPARGVIDISDYTKGADKVTIEYDNSIKSGGRLYIGLVDLDQRPAGSSGTSYTKTGVLLQHGTKDGAYYLVNSYSAYKGDTNFLDKTIHVKAVIDFTTQKITYSLSDGTGAITSTGVDFYDTETAQITGIEFYSWTSNTTTSIDNIKVTALTDVKENVLYLLKDADSGDYTVYQYINGEPICVSGGRVTSSGGFEGGTSVNVKSGKAGGAIGYGANAADGGAVGNAAGASNGFAGGYKSWTGDGAAVGREARCCAADSGGVEQPIDAIQLGTGNNANEKTLQIYSYQLLNADGYIPAARIVPVYTSETLPAASESLRGKTCIVESDTGDLIYMCRKNTSAEYEWLKITA